MTPPVVGRPAGGALAGPARPGPVDQNSALLRALLTDTLDPGYAAAARRRAERGPAGPVGDRGSRTLLGLGAFLIGLVLIAAYLDAHRAAPADARAQADLRTRVTSAMSYANELSRTVSALQAQIDGRRVAVLGRPSGNAALTELQAGTTAVRGPGLRVTVDNPAVATTGAASGRPGTTPLSAGSVLTDVDVRGIVNELWAEGAEAIAVNEVRLTPTSAIRFAGQAVLVDFQPISAPYQVSAIGDPDVLVPDFAASAVADRLRILASADGFAFDTDQEKSMTLPASAISDPRYAHIPTAPPSASAGPTAAHSS